MVENNVESPGIREVEKEVLSASGANPKARIIGRPTYNDGRWIVKTTHGTVYAPKNSQGDTANNKFRRLFDSSQKGKKGGANNNIIAQMKKSALAEQQAKNQSSLTGGQNALAPPVSGGGLLNQGSQASGNRLNMGGAMPNRPI
jgi:hypothetical protein